MLSKSLLGVSIEAALSLTLIASCGLPIINVLPASKSIEQLWSATLSLLSLSICKDKVTLLVESKFVILIRFLFKPIDKIYFSCFIYM